MNNTEILAAFSRSINDATFDKRNRAIQLGILTDAQNYIIDRTECLRKINSTGVVLVADDGDYTLPNEFVKFPTEGGDIKRGLVNVGTYGKYPLTYISLPILNSQFPGWRQTSAGTPEFYSIIESGTPELIVYPKPSATFLSANGTTVFMDIVYRPTAGLAEDSNLPFDNSYRLSGIFQILLKLRAIYQVKLEDMQFEDADRLALSTKAMFEEAADFVRSIASSPGTHGFEENFGGI